MINLLHFTPYFKINVVLWETGSDVERGPKISSHNLTWITRDRRNKIRLEFAYCTDLFRLLVLSVKYCVLEMGSVLETSVLFLMGDDAATS